MPIVHLVLFSIFSLGAWADPPSKVYLTHASQNLGDTEEIRNKKPVFVFYQADTRAAFTSAFQGHLQTIIKALRPEVGTSDTADLAFFKRLEEFILFDLELMRRTSEIESESLKRQLCFPEGRFSSNVAFFQNSTATNTVDETGYDLHSSWEYCRAGNPEQGTFKQHWKLSNLAKLWKEAVWQDQLLAHPLIFERALESLFQVFPTETHRYILVIKGRGDDELLLKSQYAFDTSALDPNTLRETFLKRKLEFGADPENFEFNVENSDRVQNILSKILPPLDENLLGLSKWQALETVARTGGGNPVEGAYFSRVILNTSHGSLELSNALKEYVTHEDYRGLNIQNIGGLRHFGKTGASPRLPVERLSVFFGPALSFEGRFSQFLDQLATQGATP